MRILSVFGWSIRIGGHFKSALAHMKCFKEMGHYVSVLVPGDDSSEDMVKEFENNGIEIIEFTKSPRRGRLPSYRGTADIIRVSKQKAIDIIHPQEFFSFPACYAAAIILKKAIIFNKAGGPVNDLFPPRKINAVFYSEELLEGMVNKYRLNRENISVIRARIDTRVYQPETVTAQFIEKYNLPVSGKKIVLATRLEEPKDKWVDKLLDFAGQALTTDMQTHVIIAGEGPLLGCMQERADDINKRNVGGPLVHLIGPVFHMSELNQLYNYADIVIGNGRGILEAMACGKPVVILSETGQAEAVGPENIDDVAFYNFSGRHFRNGEKSLPAIDSILERILGDPDQLRLLGAYSYQYIKSYMDVQLGSRQLFEVYKNALSNKLLLSDYVLWNVRFIFSIFGSAIKRRIGWAV